MDSSSTDSHADSPVAAAPPAASAPPDGDIALLPDGQPDWTAVTGEVICPRCGYNLRMLSSPRCPECGLTFAWIDVLLAARHRSAFLFEARWRDRPIRSYLGTLRRSFRPIKFWRAVSIHEQIHTGPLWFSLFLALFWFVASLVGPILLAWAFVEIVTALAEWSASSMSFEIRFMILPIMQAVVDAVDSIKDRAPPVDDPAFVPAVVGFTATAFASAFVLVIGMRQTLGRCRVRVVQVFRVFVYMTAPIFVLWSLSFQAMALAASPPADTATWIEVVLGIAFCVVAIGMPAFYIAAGLKIYLRLPHAIAMALVSVFTGMLFTYTMVCVWAAWIKGG